MKAAIFTGPGNIEINDAYPKPVIGPDDVLIRVHYCGICGSDISNYKHLIYQVPLVMGHEASGVIEEVGGHVDKWSIGDKVIPINVALDVGGTEGIGIFQDGAFAEYVKVKASNVYRIPGNVSMRDAVLIESFANAFRGVTLSGLKPGQPVAIFGAGSIGLCFLSLIKSEYDPDYILVVEPQEYLREKAKQLGATISLPPSITKIKKFIKQKGKPAFIYDCAGNERSIKMAIQIAKRGGLILIEGIMKGTISLPIFVLNNKELGLKGSLGHDNFDILNAIKFIENEKVNPEEIITDVVPLDEIHSAFKRHAFLKERHFVKTVVKVY
ncbi:MAG: zinc-dependent alcohol dehydrogenase [Promethearchaeota archaeon]